MARLRSQCPLPAGSPAGKATRICVRGGPTLGLPAWGALGLGHCKQLSGVPSGLSGRTEEGLCLACPAEDLPGVLRPMPFFLAPPALRAPVGHRRTGVPEAQFMAPCWHGHLSTALHGGHTEGVGPVSPPLLGFCYTHTHTHTHSLSLSLSLFLPHWCPCLCGPQPGRDAEEGEWCWELRGAPPQPSAWACCECLSGSPASILQAASICSLICWPFIWTLVLKAGNWGTLSRSRGVF